MDTLAIFGTGGHGFVISELATLCGWSDQVFFDDKYPDGAHDKTTSHPPSGNLRDLVRSKHEYVAVAVGDNSLRSKISQAICASGKKLVTLTHPTASISNSAIICDGVQILANTVVQAKCRVERGCILNNGCIVEHHCKIGEYCHVGPGAVLAGGAIIEPRVFLGINSSVIPDIHIENDVTVGAGAVVVANIPQGVIVAGSPAKVI